MFNIVMIIVVRIWSQLLIGEEIMNCGIYMNGIWVSYSEKMKCIGKWMEFRKY